MIEQPVVRPATTDEAAALTDLERAANLVALRHVFDPALHAFPYDAVHERWERLLGDPDVVVEVVDGVGETGDLVCLLARDTTRVRHLAVHPDQWGRGLATAALARAETAIRAGGHRPGLTCLQANDRARRLYESRGWRATGESRPAEFAPHPVELEYVLA